MKYLILTLLFLSACAEEEHCTPDQCIQEGEISEMEQFNATQYGRIHYDDL